MTRTLNLTLNQTIHHEVCSWTLDLLDMPSLEIVLGMGNDKANAAFEA